MARNSFLQAIFPKIKYSISPVSKTNKGTTQIGKVIPVYATMLNGKESISLDLGHLVRFLPTNVPVMEGYEVNFEAFKVSLNAIAYSTRMEREVMDFHNFALNDGTEVNPLSHRIEKVQGRINGVHSGLSTGVFFRPGTLGDYLNFPSLKAFRDYVREWINKTPLFDGSFDSRFMYDGVNELDSSLKPYADFFARYMLNDVGYVRSAGGTQFVLEDNDGFEYGYYTAVPFSPYPAFVYPDGSQWRDNDFVGYVYGTDILGSYLGIANIFIPECRSLLHYIIENYPLVRDYYFGNYLDGLIDDRDSTRWYNYAVAMRNSNLNLNYLDILYQFYKIDSQTIFDEWFNSIVEVLLFNTLLFQGMVRDGYSSLDSDSTLMNTGWLPDIFGVKMKPIDWTYFAAYWKIISDWYINTNIDGDPDDFFTSNCRLIAPTSGGASNFYVELEPFERRWNNDIFTSAVPSSMVQNVLIPTDGTIPDFRDANAYQKFRDILRNTGSRLRDVLFGVRGYRPTAEASHMSVPVGTLHSYVGISSVLQTTPTTSDSAQGNMSGIGVDSSHGRHILKVVNNDEPVPVVVMIMMSVTQKATYMQGFPRNFFRSSIYDFAVPQLANIGEQEVNLSELYFDYDSSGDGVALDTIFGFNRRYYDWFFEQNEVHGAMRDSEDIWHGARIFDSAPSLNGQFISIDNSADHLSRIFANTSPSASHIYYNVAIEGEKCVALPRYIQYEL